MAAAETALATALELRPCAAWGSRIRIGGRIYEAHERVESTRARAVASASRRWTLEEPNLCWGRDIWSLCPFMCVRVPVRGGAGWVSLLCAAITSRVNGSCKPKHGPRLESRWRVWCRCVPADGFTQTKLLRTRRNIATFVASCCNSACVLRRTVRPPSCRPPHGEGLHLGLAPGLPLPE